MRLLLAYVLAILVPVVAWGQSQPRFLTALSTTAAASVAASYAAKLTSKSWLMVTVANQTDCDVQIEFTDATNAPEVVVLAGVTYDVRFGENGGQLTSQVKLQKVSGETCTTGSVFLQGMYR